ncbi:MAG: DUF1570 domain-containing protein [Cycloclasticus sp.]|nr:DUF1570 domain-containing protein [Cycloclasticus sp.]
MKLFIQLVIWLVVLSGIIVLTSPGDAPTIEQVKKHFDRVVSQNEVRPPIKARAVSVPNRCDRAKSNGYKTKYNRIYQWTDKNGQAQVSDRRPTGQYTNLHIKNHKVNSFFRLTIDDSQAQLPAYTKDHVEAGVKKIYKTLKNVLKVSDIRSTELKLKFISNKNSFHAYRQHVAPDTNYQTTGFYTDRLHQSTIWAVGDRHHITRIAMHEATHAIVAAMFGGAPTWLNEGLASFFEKQVITGNDVYSYELINEHLKILHTSTLPSLKHHFSQTHQQWHDARKSNLNYAVDWSLVYYLMHTNKGRNLISSLLDNVATSSCHGLNAESFINKNYKGGLLALENSWKIWLQKARPNTMITIHGF